MCHVSGEGEYLKGDCHTYDLFLLYCEWKSFQTWVLCFEDGCVEAIVVLDDKHVIRWASAVGRRGHRLTKWMITLFSFR